MMILFFFFTRGQTLGHPARHICIYVRIFHAADLPRSVPVQRYREGPQPGTYQCAGHCNLQTGVPHRHSSEDEDGAKERCDMQM